MTDTPDLAGTRVGRYDVISLLGRGGMGGNTCSVPLFGSIRTSLHVCGPEWSPTGDRIAVLLGDPDEYSARLGVLSAADGRLLWEAPLSSVRIGSTIRWLPDSSGLLVNGGPEDNRNLWVYPFDGKPRRLTDFNDQLLFFWELSADGKEAVVARATISRDAALISGFR